MSKKVLVDEDLKEGSDLAAATAGAVNQLRQAIMVQSLLELDARGGTRYVELLRAHFNVISPDFRLQLAEYLGGAKAEHAKAFGKRIS